MIRPDTTVSLPSGSLGLSAKVPGDGSVELARPQPPVACSTPHHVVELSAPSSSDIYANRDVTLLDDSTRSSASLHQ